MKIGLEIPVGIVVTALASEAGERNSSLTTVQFFKPFVKRQKRMN